MKRLGYIDDMKAIAMAFIIVGHLGLVFSSTAVAGGMPPDLERFAFTFHLPVFFIASGFFFKLDTAISKHFIAKSFKALVVPYFVTCLIVILGTSIRGTLSADISGSAEFVRWLQASLWGAGATSPVALWNVERIGGVWFLLAMFWARIFIASTRRFSDSTRFCIMLIALAFAVLSARYIWLPWSIQSGLGCAIYIYIGALARKHNLFEPGRLSKPTWILFCALWLICIVFGGRASIAMCGYPLGIIDIVGGIAACFIVMALSRMIESHCHVLSTFMQWIGRNTLPIFALHIVEDNIIPWGALGIQLADALNGAWWTWIVLLLARFAIDAALTGIAYFIPGIRKIYFPQLTKK